jgi:Flp pilus assembly protein TadD
LVPVLIISALMPWWSQQDVAAGNAAVAAGQPAMADSKASEASWLNPFSIQPWLLKARAAALRGDPVALRNAARQATVVQPDNPSAWTILALALGDSAAGRNAWRHVLQLNPLDIRARAALEDTRP